MSDQNMLSLDCSSEHCNFRTPVQGREQYQAMVAHLQVHSALAHGAALPASGRGSGCNVAGCAGGFEDRDASALRSRSRSRSRRRDRIFRCTDCNDRAYETEKGLKIHKLRYCGKPREEGVFPCTACDKVFVAAGLLKMHTGRFHTDRSALRVEGSHDQENVDNRSEEDAAISTRNEGRETPARESTSSVGEVQRELLGNNEARASVPRSSSSNGNCGVGTMRMKTNGNCGVRGSETSAVQKPHGVEMNTSAQERQTARMSTGGIAPRKERQSPGWVATSSSRKGRNDSPAESEWSDSSIVSSTEERMKSLVNVEMVVQNRVTRVTYRVTSTAPIGMILTKVASRLGTEEGKIQLRLGNVANGGAGEVPRDRGLLVDVMDSAGDFKNRVIHAVVVA